MQRDTLDLSVRMIIVNWFHFNSVKSSVCSANKINMRCFTASGIFPFLFVILLSVL